MDYLLRSATESDLDDALIAAGLAEERTDEEGEVMVLPVEGVSLDRIGSIPAQVNEEGIIIRSGNSLYHANLRVAGELTAEQVAELPILDPPPSHPMRVWA
jgi:hypothetical protein